VTADNLLNKVVEVYVTLDPNLMGNESEKVTEYLTALGDIFQKK
jgi:hypothetical protein